MPAVLLLIGAVILIAAVRNTQGDLGTALMEDAQGFFKWALAVGVVGGIGYAPGLRTTSRWLLALVLVVLVLTNYSKFFAAFTNLAQATPAGGTANPTPAQAYVANPSAPQITTAEISGTGGASADPTATAVAQATSVLDPQHYLAPFTTDLASMGFGGVA